jgi:sugar transferase (PEP-CTERM system associated)
MRAQILTGIDGSTATTTVANTLTAKYGQPGRAALGSLGTRTLHVIGRSALGLAPSTWLLVDVSVLLLGVYVAFLVFPPPLQPRTPHIVLWQAAAIFAFAVIIASLVFGLYERETVRSRSHIITRIVLTGTTATVIAYAIIYVIMYATVSRRVSALAMSLFVVTGTMIRLAVWWIAHKVHCGLLVVGSRALFESFEGAKAGGLLQEYRLMGYATCGDEAPGAANDPNFVGTVTEQIDKLGPLRVTDIVVSDGAARDPRVMEWMVPFMQRGCRVTNEATFYEKATGQILVDQITPSWFLFADLKVHCDEHATLKRVMDLGIAVIGLCLSAPLWPLIALAVKLCDRGPVFYTQDRVGQNGNVFKLYKFRTMRPDAENGKSVWSSPNDPRVTPVGRLLRRTRLDELPQLYNVLAGQMSIVGPRPERPDIVRDLCTRMPFYAERHLVKPGITGWAQISFRYGSSIEDAKRKLQFDLYYLKHVSFELDTIILFRTAGTFLRGAC